MKKLIITSLMILFFSSCVSESEHRAVVSERNSLAIENNNINAEIEEIKFGAPNLLADGKQFYEAKEFSKAKEKFQTLLEKHPDLPQSIEAKTYLLTIDEEELWNVAKISEDINTTQTYISRYPKGKYKTLAIEREKEIKTLNIEKAYDNALNTNTSSAWKRFLEDYPDHIESSAINEKIIRLEVDEISGDSSTGVMPSLDQNDRSYSSSSSVKISNNTGCLLTIRYSGPEAKKIEIPSDGKMTVYLSSGSYKIAASACGSNYAATENLQGNYNSTFYISRSRY